MCVHAYGLSAYLVIYIYTVPLKYCKEEFSNTYIVLEVPPGAPHRYFNDVGGGGGRGDRGSYFLP